MQHLIKKQTVGLQLSKQMDAFHIQQQASAHYQRDVLPVLEEVFNELSDEDEYIRIEELEIDLGIISEKEMLQEHWSDVVLSKLKEEIRKKLQSKKKDGTEYFTTMKPISICRQWLFYMERGWLPWNALHITEEWYNNVLEALAVDFVSVEALRKLIRENETALRRITMQHDEGVLIKLTEILTAKNQRGLQGAVGELQAIFSVAGTVIPLSAGSRKDKTGIWQQVMKFAATEEKLNTGQLIEKIFLGHLPDNSAIKRIITDHSLSIPVILPVLKRLEEKPGLFKERKLSAKKETNKTKEKQEQATDNTIDEEGIFVNHAGVVLTHPFLNSLFKRLLLVKEGKFENKAAQQKALYLLHYLSAGKTGAEEFELTVPKLLCEWPMEMPVEKNIGLNNEEINEADNMLQAMIEQWAVLKNTSVDGLREGFLLRNGKLFRKNDKLYLHVESRTIDVLLDPLPWNLNMIKLPWMKELLRVEWR